MKFSSPKHRRLVLNGLRPGPGSRAVRFVDGAFETDDAQLAERILRSGARFGVTALKDDTGSPFDPTRASASAVNAYLTAASPAERARVADAERAGKNRPTALKGFDEPASGDAGDQLENSNTRSSSPAAGDPGSGLDRVTSVPPVPSPSLAGSSSDVLGNDSPADVLGGDQAPAEG